MTENKGENKFDNQFHKRYIGEPGDVVDRSLPRLSTDMPILSYEDILKEYRAYVRDPKAELPEEILETLRLGGKI